jgi:hypothetical protein
MQEEKSAAHKQAVTSIKKSLRIQNFDFT